MNGPLLSSRIAQGTFTLATGMSWKRDTRSAAQDYSVLWALAGRLCHPNRKALHQILGRAKKSYTY